MSSLKCLPARRAAREPGREPRSSSRGPKPGDDRLGASEMAAAVTGRAMSPAGGRANGGAGAERTETTEAPGGERLPEAIDQFLVQLRVERGLADATLRAYRADLLDFAASRGAAAEWDHSADIAVRYLGMLGAPGPGRRA